MAGRKLSRFLNLERKREPAEAPASPKPQSARFSQLELEERPVEVAAAPGHLERFEAQVHCPLELDTERKARSFLRCCRCEVDSSVYATRCQQCGADLSTEEQREFNDQLHRERARQAEVEQKASADLEAQRAALGEEEARLKRAAYEELARSVARETRARLDGTEGRPDSLWRLARQLGLSRRPLAGGLGGLFVIAAGVALLAGGARALAVVVGLALVAAFSWWLRR